MKCSKCGLEKESLKACSQCLKQGYCSKDCQKADWSSHKLVCRCFVIEDVGAKGLGWVAVSDIKEGSRIFLEEVLIPCQNIDNHTQAHALVVPIFKRTVDALSQKGRDAFWALRDPRPTEDPEMKAVRIYQENTFTFPPGICKCINF